MVQPCVRGDGREGFLLGLTHAGWKAARKSLWRGHYWSLRLPQDDQDLVVFTDWPGGELILDRSAELAALRSALSNWARATGHLSSSGLRRPPTREKDPDLFVQRVNKKDLYKRLHKNGRIEADVAEAMSDTELTMPLMSEPEWRVD